MSDLGKILMERVQEAVRTGKPTTTALIEAVNAGKHEEAKSLLEKGEYVNGIDILDNTALIYAASAGNLKIVKLLLSYHAIIDHKNIQGSIAYSSAENQGHKQIAELLSKSKNCDICIRVTSKPELKVIPLSAIKEAVKKGWRPSTKDIRRILQGFKIMQNISDKELDEIFYKQVMSDKGNWGFCSDCASKFRTASERMDVKDDIANDNEHTKKGPNTKSVSKSKNCDICIKAISKSELEVIPQSEVKDALKKGWFPSNKDIRDIMRVVMNTQNISNKELKNKFYDHVMYGKKDWGFCSDCASRFRTAQKRIINEQMDANKNAGTRNKQTKAGKKKKWWHF